MRAVIAVAVSAVIAVPLLAQTDARGIDPDAAGPAMRVWSHRQLGQQEVWFRRELQLAGQIEQATLVFSCDNVATVYVNGEKIAHSNDWEELTVVDVSRLLKQGDNTIAIHAKNAGSCAALAAWLTWHDAKGGSGEVVTDATWRYSEQHKDGWAQPGFDMTAWAAAAATIATPYGNNVYNGKPRALRFLNSRTASADEIDAALRRFRSARTQRAARNALDELDRAVMRARAELWKQREKSKPRSRDRKRDR